RRMQGLVALGYSVARLSREADYSEGNMKRLINGRMDYIKADTHTKLAETYDRLCMKIPTARDPHLKGGISRARGRAASEGWPPPLFWDDIDNDVLVVTEGRPWRRKPKNASGKAVA